MTDKQFLELARMLRAIYYAQRAQVTDEPLTIVDFEGPEKLDNHQLIHMADANVQSVIEHAEQRNQGSSR